MKTGEDTVVQDEEGKRVRIGTSHEKLYLLEIAKKQFDDVLNGRFFHYVQKLEEEERGG